MERIPLSKLRAKQKAIVISVIGGHMAAKRLADLGVTPGTEVTIKRRAPISGPVEIEARGSNLILGRNLASRIIVELL